MWIGNEVRDQKQATGSQCLAGKTVLSAWKEAMPGDDEVGSEQCAANSQQESSEPVSEEMLRNAYHLSRLRSSSVEIREKGSERLKEELAKAQRELKLKDEECEKLSKVREQLEQELEELTASLFEEAHKMVREANTKQATAEKQLKEAQGKIDVLLAEVTALKTLVITSTPSSPNRELHPQLQSPSKAVFKKGHSRNKSLSSAIVTAATQNTPLKPISKDGREAGVPTLLSLLLCIVPGRAIYVTPEPYGHLTKPSSIQEHQIDLILFEEFQSWKEDPTLDKASPFLERIYQEDISPCLSFAKHELTEAVQTAVENNTLSIEPAAAQALPVVKASAMECGGPNGWRAEVLTKCALSGLSRTCKHRIKLGDSGNYFYISPSCRSRITAVCNFFTYIRYIQQGLVRQDVEQMYWEVMKLRKEMSIAKLGYYTEES
ncbi:guanine nucleotide exchange factor for Rab-3A-like isoform X6 [Stegostoma tigrinum]|uniref:guanine nucleotide exchange factor for Rab-3A-like isoform X6 n=1 Tax=Stegostoma tigrinum TaxID=3053191 RepID=UPI00202B2B7B|nr:guanine nucleotide exchange factor for Rab-3A-like isoform X6 [Stegostoma tigrinum]XP_048401525.1 guanine nucleotide exchange factor for Rab-3A-like isoform X6 [Stegostoma tigrinum]